MATKTYDFKKVTLVLGPHIISGYAEGTGIQAEAAEDTWMPKTGSDGEFVRSKSNNNEGSVTITLLPSSKSNDVLSALHLADKESNAGLVPLLLKDLQGTTLIAASEAYVVKPANVGFGQEAENREWVIYSGDLKMLVGGIG